MSARVYRLLRNNKEEGPFTAEELIHKNLKTYDLIWVDGRSAAWNYPGEMPEFKMYAPLLADVTSALQKNRQNNPLVSASVQAAMAVNENIVTSSAKEKPRYKVSAAWSRIQTITALQFNNVKPEETKKPLVKRDIAAKEATGAQSKSLSWEEAWQDWEKEKKSATPVFQAEKRNYPSAVEKKAVKFKNQEPILETKYAEPLDSLKDKYIDNIIQQKQKSKKSLLSGKASEFVLPSLALLVIFSIGYWLLHDTNKIASDVSNVAVNSSKPAVIQNTVASSTPVSPVDDTVTNNFSQAGSNDQQMPAADEPVINDQAEDRKTSYTDPAKPAVSKHTEEQKKQNIITGKQNLTTGTKTLKDKPVNLPAKQDSSSISNPLSNNTYHNVISGAEDLTATAGRPVRRRTNTGNDQDESKSNQPTEKKEISAAINNNSKEVNSYVAVPEYIEMANGSADLKVQNVSDINLDLVVIDLQYYDASNRFRKGETLYLHNLKASKNVVIKTPKDLTSFYATSKISLVSSDEKHVYVVGDK